LGKRRNRTIPQTTAAAGTRNESKISVSEIMEGRKGDDDIGGEGEIHELPED